MITRQQYLKGRERKFSAEFTPELSSNTDKIIARASELLSRFGEDRAVTSGWRPKSINSATPGASPTSQHIYCNAIDIEDSKKTLGQWCIVNIEVLVELGLYMESLLTTHNSDNPWVHLQDVPPKSGSRIFIP